MSNCQRCGFQNQGSTVTCGLCGTHHPPTIVQAVSPLEVGSLVNDRYQVDRLVGYSRTCAVYQVADTRCHGLALAMKVMRPDLKRDPVSLEDFNLRCTVAAKLNHPHLAKVYDLGQTEDGSIFYTLQLLDSSHSLEIAASRDKAMAAPLAWRYLLQLASAVALLNSEGMITTYLHPRNIYLLPGRLFDRLILGEPPISQGILGKSKGTTTNLRTAELAGTAYSLPFNGQAIPDDLEHFQVKQLALIAVVIFGGLLTSTDDVRGRLQVVSGLRGWLKRLGQTRSGNDMRDLLRDILVDRSSVRYKVAEFVDMTHRAVQGRTYVRL